MSAPGSGGRRSATSYAERRGDFFRRAGSWREAWDGEAASLPGGSLHLQLVGNGPSTPRSQRGGGGVMPVSRRRTRPSRRRPDRRGRRTDDWFWCQPAHLRFARHAHDSGCALDGSRDAGRNSGRSSRLFAHRGIGDCCCHLRLPDGARERCRLGRTAGGHLPVCRVRLSFGSEACVPTRCTDSCRRNRTDGDDKLRPSPHPNCKGICWRFPAPSTLRSSTNDASSCCGCGRSNKHSRLPSVPLPRSMRFACC